MKKRAFSGAVKTDSKEAKLLISALKGFGICLFLCFIGGFFFFICDMDFENAFIFSIFTYVISSFYCGYSAGRKIKENGIMFGALSGCCFFLMCLLIALCMQPHFNLDTLYKFIISIISGAIGGVLGVNKRNKKKLKPRK